MSDQVIFIVTNGDEITEHPARMINASRTLAKDDATGYIWQQYYDNIWRCLFDGVYSNGEISYRSHLAIASEVREG